MNEECGDLIFVDRIRKMAKSVSMPNDTRNAMLEAARRLDAYVRKHGPDALAGHGLVPIRPDKHMLIAADNGCDLIHPVTNTREARLREFETAWTAMQDAAPRPLARPGNTVTTVMGDKPAKSR